MKPILNNTGVLKIIFTSFIITAINYCVKAQDFFNYIQSTNNLTPLNSAYSLTDNTGSVNALIRKQLLGVPGSPSTFIFNASVPVPGIRAATGVIAMDDEAAVEHLTELNLFFAKSVRLTEDKFLGVSMNAGIRKYLANYSSLDANDPQFTTDVRQSQPNLGFGVMLYTDRYYVGLSVPELSIKSLGTASIDNANYLTTHYNVSAACLINTSESVIFKPSAVITYSAGAPVIADVLSTVFLNRTIGFGFDMRSNREVAGVLSFCLDNIQVGYSYQFPTSFNSSGVNFATHALTLNCRFGKNLSERRLL